MKECVRCGGIIAEAVMLDAEDVCFELIVCRECYSRAPFDIRRIR